jgi:DNA-binding CsgD family transcriptional regulator
VGGGCVMAAPATASERDLRALAAIVSEDRLDLADGEGLPPSLLADLMDLIPSDYITFWGSEHKPHRPAWFIQQTAPDEGDEEAYWQHHQDCPPTCYPERGGDLRRVIKYSDFYSPRQWHNSGIYRDYYQAAGVEHRLMLFLPATGWAPGSGILRLAFSRGTGADFSERDRAVLTLLRPHLHQAYLDAERRRHPVPRLTPRQWELLHLLAAGHTNTQIARRLGISAGTVRTHLENIYTRLHVPSRTAAVTRAFPGRVL